MSFTINQPNYILQLGDRVLVTGIEPRIVIETNEGYNYVREGLWDLALTRDEPSLEALTTFLTSVHGDKTIQIEKVGEK